MSNFPWLVADLGGTNARFGLVSAFTGAGSLIDELREFKTADFETFEVCLEAYLSSVGVAPHSLCLSVAGRVDGDMVQFTNLSWRIDAQAVKARFALESVIVMNDFEALALSIPLLGSKDLITILPGKDVPAAPKVIVGPGTGLGVANLVHVRGGWCALPGEGGHVAYAAQSPREVAALQQMQKHVGYVSAETFLCGPGLVNLFNALAEVDGVDDRVHSAGEVTLRALEESDPRATEVLELFSLGLATRAGDAAVTMVAAGGVYLGGGILPRIHPFLQTSDFATRFCSKGAQEHFMKGVPVYLIVNKHAALLGAAAFLAENSVATSC